MDDLWTLPQVAAAAGITPPTVYKRVASGRLPQPVRSGGLVRWIRSQVEEAIELEAGLVSTREASEWLQVSRGTLRAMVADGRLPSPVRRGNADYWRRANVEAVIAGPPGATDAGVVADTAAELQGLLRRSLELATEWAVEPPSIVDPEPPDKMPDWSVIEEERAERILNEGRGVSIDLVMFENEDGGLWMDPRRGLNYIRIVGKHQFLRAVEELLDRSGIPDGPKGGLPTAFNPVSGETETQPDNGGGAAAR